MLEEYRMLGSQPHWLGQVAGTKVEKVRAFVLPPGEIMKVTALSLVLFPSGAVLKLASNLKVAAKME